MGRRATRNLFSPWTDAFVQWFVDHLLMGKPKTVDDDLIWSRLTERLIWRLSEGGLKMDGAVALWSEDDGLIFASKRGAIEIAEAWGATVPTLRRAGLIFEGAIVAQF